MATIRVHDGGTRRMRAMIWGGAAALWLLPLLAMQFSEEVAWGAGDFLVFGAMLAAACGGYELATRVTHRRSYRAAAGLAVLAAFLLVWANLAVGLIGAEDHPANLMYAGVLAVGIAGAILARAQPRGMAHALLATALAQAGAALIAWAAGWGQAWLPTVFFVALWLGSAGLFFRDAKASG